MRPNYATYPFSGAAKTSGSPALYAVAALSMLAALNHLWLMPNHLAASAAYGALFAALSLIHGLYAVALVRWPARSLLVFGAFVNLGVFAFYVAERLVRESFGPHAAHASVFELSVMLCTAAQIGLLSCLLLDEAGTLFAAEFLCFGVSVAHLWEAQSRYAEWWGFGVFFLAFGLGGAAYCLLLPRLARSRGFLLAGVFANLFLVGAWVATRAAGVPYLDPAGDPRLGKALGVGFLDLAAITMETTLVFLLAALAARARPAESRVGPETRQTVKARRVSTDTVEEG